MIFGHCSAGAANGRRANVCWRKVLVITLTLPSPTKGEGIAAEHFF
jgi:hypothetical protein